MRILATVLILSGCILAQDSLPKTFNSKIDARKACRVLSSCQKTLERTFTAYNQLFAQDTQNVDDYNDLLDMYNVATGNDQRHLASIEDLSDRNRELEGVLKNLSSAADEFVRVHNRLADEYQSLTNQYNQVVGQYNQLVFLLNSQAARPRYSPPAFSVYQPPSSLKLHCVSNNTGNMVYTNCY